MHKCVTKKYILTVCSLAYAKGSETQTNQRTYVSLCEKEKSMARPFSFSSSAAAAAAAAAAVASRASRSGKEEDTAVPEPTSARPKNFKPRKRSRTVHERQVVNNWLSNRDRGHNDKAPVEALSKIPDADLSVDAYKVEEGKDVSLESLEPALQRKMLDSIQDLGSVLQGSAIRGDHDPTAIVVPPGHCHDELVLSEDVMRTAITPDLSSHQCGIKEGHQERFSLLYNYTQAEIIFSQYAVDKQSEETMSLGELTDSLAVCYVHSFFVPESGQMAYVIFELDELSLFYCTVGMKLKEPYKPGNYDWTIKDKDEYRQIEGNYLGYAYHACDCA